MLDKEGRFDLNTEFTYDKEWADEMYQVLINNQKLIKKYVKENDLIKQYNASMNIFKTRAKNYNPYANQEDDEVKTDRYFYIYDSMYNYQPKKNLWGKEKPFVFQEEMERVSATFGVSRALSKKEIVTPFFTPIESDKIGVALNKLSANVEFVWNNDNPLALISKIVACITAIQPLNDGNHRTSHAMIQYYIAKAGLPSIERNKHLREHYIAYTKFERNAIRSGDINDLIAYFFYNILERQEQMCVELGSSPKEILNGRTFCVSDEKIL